MKKYFIVLGVCLVLIGGFFVLNDVHAATSTVSKAMDQLTAGSVKAGYGAEAQDPRIIASRMINVLIGLLGVIVTVLFVLAGWHFVSSQGNEEKVSKAQKIMQGAVIGLIIILLSYSISYFLGRAAQEAVGIDQTGVPQQYKNN